MLSTKEMTAERNTSEDISKCIQHIAWVNTALKLCSLMQHRIVDKFFLNWVVMVKESIICSVLIPQNNWIMNVECKHINLQ